MTFLLFWGAVSLLAYTYVLFPLLVWVRGALGERPYTSAEITPRVSLIIAAHNEGDTIAAKLANVLALDYPRDRLETIVASDGSTDETEGIVRRCAGPSVRLLPLSRQGKAKTLNAAVAASTGEILVFSDANSMYDAQALRALVRPFADLEVGGVAGNQVYLADSRSAVTGIGERRYWDFDRMVKRSQGLAGNVTSATGAIYAIRRSLFSDVPEAVTDDFVTSTRVVAQGYRLVFAQDAVAYEAVAGSGKAEFRRKVRIITRGLRAVLVMRTLLNPFRYGFYALQLFSHKVMRRLMVFPLLVLVCVSPVLWHEGLLYQLATLGQAGFCACAALGWLLHHRHSPPQILALPSFFCMVNAASLLATFNVVLGRRITQWEPRRPASQVARATAPAPIERDPRALPH